MTDLAEQLAKVIQRKFLNEGLDASYMSDEEIARVAAEAVDEVLEPDEFMDNRYWLNRGETYGG